MTRSPRRRGTSLLAGLTALLIAALTACSGQASTFSGPSGGGSGSGDQGTGGDKTVSISVVAGWDEDVAASYLWKELLEQRGYTVNLQELDIASTFTGVANGQLDLYLDAWLPTTHGVYWDRFKDDLEVVTSWQTGKNTLVVPDYVDVDTIAELKGRAAEFQGRIVGIEAGAGEMKAMREQVIPTYQLTDYNLVEGSSPAMLAALDSAIKQNQPIVVTLWQPHWAFSRWQLKVLDDTQQAFGEPDQMQIIATKGWGAANPEVAGWLKNYTITPEQLSSLMLEIQNAGKGQEQVATKQWISENQQVVDAWFNGTTS
ncbi:MAG: glycine betaine ABC transporter substrate-binding protein [Pseudonocardia sp.]